MSFLNPSYLWLALLPIVPLLLYLLPLPRRRIPASALYLWRRFLQSEPFGRASERFRRVLGFALLAAILASLVLAAADLTVGRSPTSAGTVIVLIDTSASMNAVTDGRSSLDRAKRAAGRFVASLGADTPVALAETPGRLNVLRTLPPSRGADEAPSRSELAYLIDRIEPFDGPGELGRALAEAYRLWGRRGDAEVHAFTDRPLPASPWGARAHAWIAPSPGDNVAMTDLAAERRGRQVTVRFTVANFGRSARALSGTVNVNGRPRGAFDTGTLPPGASVRRSVRFGEPNAARVEVSLLGAADALAADDTARVVVPSLGALRVAVAWPEPNKRNPYVAAMLSALKDEGVVGEVVVAGETAEPVCVYANHCPARWPAGGAIVLYPLRGGVVAVGGLHGETVTVTRQADHPLLADVDLRGLSVKGAVRADVPGWAKPLAWAGDLPVVWAGRSETTKVLLVGIPIRPTGSRFPVAAAFPLLMRNALRWMLPGPRALRPGETVGGWTSRRAGLATCPADGTTHAFSVLSAKESDLRRSDGVEGETLGARRSLAAVLVVLAMAMLAVDWALFHRRLTE